MEDDQVVERGSFLTAGSVQLQSDDIELQKSLLYKGSAGNSIPIFTN